jgi:hypothetical protein
MKGTMMTMVALAAVPAMLTAQQPQRDTSRTQADTGRMNVQQTDSAVHHADVHDSAAVRTGRTVPASPQDTLTVPQRVGFDKDSAAAQGQQQGQQGVAGQQGQADQGQTMGQASGRNVRAGLTSEQLMQLQQTLTAIGCDVGTADGRPGRKTREALTCAQRKLAATKSTGAQATTPSPNMQQDALSHNMQNVQSQQTVPATRAVQGDSSEVGGRNMGRVRPPEDTAAPVSGQQTGDTSATNRARQQGMTDSTTMRPDSSALQGTTPGRRVNQMNESGDTTSSALRDSLLKANTGTKPTADTTRRTPPQR